jgi:hypothetical protein
VDGGINRYSTDFPSEIGLELMSSTSEICELWNGERIIRIRGLRSAKYIIKFGIPDTEMLPPNNVGIYDFESAKSKGIL